MGVRDLEADDGHADALARDGALELEGDIAGKQSDAGQQVVGQVEVAVHLQLGNNQRMALGQRHDVEKGEEAVVLGNLMARDFTGHDAGKEAGHGGWPVSRVRF